MGKNIVKLKRYTRKDIVVRQKFKDDKDWSLMKNTH